MTNSLSQPVDGVTKYDLVYTPSPALPQDELRELIGWRTVLYRLGLIGLDPQRYGGVGFGNVSRRLTTEASQPRFAISGTQTGGLPALEARHFAVVNASYPERNRVEAEGPIAPSSESLTHGMLYRLDDNIGVVLHVHSPDIWRRADILGLPRTAAEVDYGTPTMADEMARLWRERARRRTGVLVMGGHEDGVIAFGGNPEQAGLALLRIYAQSVTEG